MTGTVKRRITKFDFSDETSHVALVDKAANLQEVLVMKSHDKLNENSHKENVMTTEVETKEVKLDKELDTLIKDENLKLDIHTQIAKAKAEGALEAQAELKKAMAEVEAVKADAQKEIAKARKEATVELMKTFVRKSIKLSPFVDGDEKDFAKALMSVHSLGKEGALVISALEKAAHMHIDTLSFDELGVTLSEEQAPMTGLQKALLAK